MQLGPVEYIVIEFPGSHFKGDIVPALRNAVASGQIRILDLVFIRKHADGMVEVLELNALDPNDAASFGDLDGEIRGLISEDDLAAVAENLTPGSSAGLLVWENSWAVELAVAVRAAQGRIVANERVKAADAEAAMLASAVSL